MSAKNYREIVEAQIKHEQTSQQPYFLEFTPPLERDITKYYGSPDWIYAIEPYIVQRSCFDTWDTIRYNSACQGMDAYGSTWTVTEKIAHLDTPAVTKETYGQYSWPVLDDFVSEQKLRWVKAVYDAYDRSFRVFHVGGGLYELSWRMLGVEPTLMHMIEDEDFYQDILDNLCELLLGFIDEAAKLPVEGVLIGDDWCDQRGVTFGHHRFRELFKERYKMLFQRIHEHGKYAMAHVCGDVSSIIPDLIEIGLDVLESVQPEPEGMNPFELKRLYGEQITFWGGLGVQHDVMQEDPSMLRHTIQKLRNEMSKNGGYILAPAKPLNTDIPLENVITIFETFIGRG